MRKVLSRLFVCFWVALVAVCGTRIAAAQTPPPPQKKTCCSNFRVYSAFLNGLLNHLCENNQDVPKKLMDDYRATIRGKGLGEQGNKCAVLRNEESPFKDPKDDAEGCYSPSLLATELTKTMHKAFDLCQVPVEVVVEVERTMLVIPPRDIVQPQITIQAPPCSCCTDIQCPAASCPCAKSGGGGLADDPAKPAPPPLPPQIPTDAVFNSSMSHVSLPSDTRSMSLSLPLSVNQDSSYVSVGTRIRPAYVWYAEKQDWKNRTPGWSFERMLHVAFGASNGPKWNTDNTGFQKAVALGLDLLNNKDQFFDGGTAKCIKDKTAKLDIRGLGQDAARTVYNEVVAECTKNSLALALQFATGFRGVGGRPQAVFEWSPIGSLSFATYAGPWFLTNSQVVPVEWGAQASLFYRTFSLQTDGSIMRAFNGGDLYYKEKQRWRGSMGFGGSVALFNGLSANLGLRYVPASWDSSGPEGEFRFISGIAWAGMDASAEYANGQWSTKWNEEMDKRRDEAKRKQNGANGQAPAVPQNNK